MTAPVRLRGEVGERRQGAAQERWYDDIDCCNVFRFTGPERERHPFEFRDKREHDCRTNLDTAARVDAIVAAIRDPLNEVIARLKAENATLARQLNEHMDEVAHLTGTVEYQRGVIAKAARAIERDRIEPLLAKGQPEGCHE